MEVGAHPGNGGGEQLLHQTHNPLTGHKRHLQVQLQRKEMGHLILVGRKEEKGKDGINTFKSNGRGRISRLVAEEDDKYI